MARLGYARLGAALNAPQNRPKGQCQCQAKLGQLSTTPVFHHPGLRVERGRYPTRHIRYYNGINKTRRGRIWTPMVY